MPRGNPLRTLEERFLERCTQLGDCLFWQGGKTTNGYGQLLKKTYGTGYAHQWACHHWNQSPMPIEKGMCIKHSCDNKLCVNPKHLTYGTLQENIQEMNVRNPTAFGKVTATQEEIKLLEQMINDNVSRREMSRRIGHSRHWIDRVIRDTLLSVS